MISLKLDKDFSNETSQEEVLVQLSNFDTFECYLAFEKKLVSSYSLCWMNVKWKMVPHLDQEWQKYWAADITIDACHLTLNSRDCTSKQKLTISKRTDLSSLLDVIWWPCSGMFSEDAHHHDFHPLHKLFTKSFLFRRPCPQQMHSHSSWHKFFKTFHYLTTASSFTIDFCSWKKIIKL